MWPFVSGLGIVYTALCAYIGARMFGIVRFFFPGMKVGFLALAFWLPFALLCYANIIFNFLHLNRLHFLRIFSSYWMAFFAYMLVFLVMFDLVRLVFLLLHRSVLTPHFSAAGVSAAIVLCFMMIASGTLHARSIRTANYVLNVAGCGDNLRIALISDLHIGLTVDQAWVARVVNTINQAEPDMVCVAGDIFDSNMDSVSDMPGIVSELRRIKAPLGVYACLGNHDVDRISLSQGGGNERIVNFLHDAGIVLLEDEVREIGENIYLAGRRDPRPIGMRSSRKSAAELLAGLDRDRTHIVMEHQPTQFPQVEQAGADLLLCGHTHAGQIFPATLITRYIYKKAGGTHYGHWQGKTMQAVVTSGVGMWGPPIRVGTDSEVAVIDIHFN